jgi:hypothetical protein
MNKIKKSIAELQFWWAKKLIKDGRDFDIQVDDVGNLVTILRGDFKGTQFRYSPLTVREDDDALVDFHTHVVYYPKGVDLSNYKFAKLTTNILRILLAEAVSEPEDYTKELNDANRNLDTSEFIEERDFYEESPPVLKKRVSERKPRKKAVRTDKPVHSEVQPITKSKRTRVRTPRTK